MWGGTGCSLESFQKCGAGQAVGWIFNAGQAAGQISKLHTNELFFSRNMVMKTGFVAQYFIVFPNIL